MKEVNIDRRDNISVIAVKNCIIGAKIKNIGLKEKMKIIVSE